MSLSAGWKKFCREHNVLSIRNRTQGGSGYSGAIAWPLMGYDFEDPTDAGMVSNRLLRFAEENQYRILGDISEFKKPWDFVQIEGLDKKGKKFALGREFLTSEKIDWRAKRDLRYESDGTKILIEYVKRKNPKLIKECFSDYADYNY